MSKFLLGILALIDEGVSGVAALIDDIVVGFEHAVGERVCVHELLSLGSERPTASP